jgi:hypothetical protein
VNRGLAGVSLILVIGLAWLAYVLDVLGSVQPSPPPPARPAGEI